MALTLTSDAFAPGKAIPRKYSCEGADLSPPLFWSGLPEGTRSLVLICSDPDAPGRTFYHWGLYNIPPDWSGLAEGFGNKPGGDGAGTVLNDFGRPGYGGPCPPHGHGTHHYHFRLSALGDASLSPPPSATCPQLEAALEAHVLASTELIGTYER